MDSKLVAAFKFHMRDSVARPRFWHALGQKGLAGLGKGIAIESLARARRDVAEGKNRYPNPYPKLGHGKGWKPESDGLRYVGRVVPDARCHSIWDSRGNSGWYADLDGYYGNLCFGVVYQLPGRNGESRFVAGYDWSDFDGGPTLDMSRVFVESRSDWRGRAATDCDAARDAARAADSMAQHAAEEEREYRTAWLAGSLWNDAAESIAAARKESLAILAERRKVKGTEGFPVLCNFIRQKVSDLVQSIAESRAEQLKLAEGEYRDLHFWNGEQRLRDAFCEGAGLDKFPA